MSLYPDNGDAPLEVTIDFLWDGGGIFDYVHWNFGDGGSYSTTQTNYSGTYTYANPGTYNATEFVYYQIWLGGTWEPTHNEYFYTITVNNPTPTQVSYAETISASDGQALSASITEQEFSSSSDAVNLSANSGFTDGFSSAESGSQLGSLTKAESIAAAESQSQTTSLSFVESVARSESQQSSASHTNADSLTRSESQTPLGSQLQTESLSRVEAQSVSSSLSNSEALSRSESQNTLTENSATDTITFTDARQVLGTPGVFENLAVGETYNTFVNVNFSENPTFSESRAQANSPISAETIAPLDSAVALINNLIAETFTSSEGTFLQQDPFSKQVGDSAGFSELSTIFSNLVNGEAVSRAESQVVFSTVNGPAEQPLASESFANLGLPVATENPMFSDAGSVNVSVVNSETATLTDAQIFFANLTRADVFSSTDSQNSLGLPLAADNLNCTEARTFAATLANPETISPIETQSAFVEYVRQDAFSYTETRAAVVVINRAENPSFSENQISNIKLNAAFTIPTSIQAGTHLYPANTSAGANTQQWRVNGALVSTEYAPDLAPHLQSGENTVSLTAINDSESQTQTKTVAANKRIVTLGNVTSNADTNLPGNVGFKYRIRARDAVGNWSKFSDAIIGETQPIWTPGNLPQLAAWYRAKSITDGINTQPYSVWQDLKNSYDTSSPNPPRFFANGGAPYLEFDGTDDVLNTNIVSLNDFAIVVVFEEVSHVTYGRIISQGYYGGIDVFTYGSSVYFDFHASRITAEKSSGLQALYIERSGSNSRIRFAGVESTGAITTALPTGQLRMCGTGNPGEFANLRLREVIICSDDIQANDFNKLAAYILSEHGITL